jgi:hypothetical protein
MSNPASHQNQIEIRLHGSSLSFEVTHTNPTEQIDFPEIDEYYDVPDYAEYATYGWRSGLTAQDQYDIVAAQYYAYDHTPTATLKAEDFIVDDPDLSWVHIGATASSNNVMKLWRNGEMNLELDGDGKAVDPKFLRYNAAVLGLNNNGDEPFNGVLRDVRLYARTLEGYEMMKIVAANDMRKLPAHQWALESDGKDTGTADALVDVTLQGDAVFLPIGGVLLDGVDDSLSLGDTFAFAATDGFTWCAWVRYDQQVEDWGTLLYLRRQLPLHNYIILRTYLGKTTRRAQFHIRNADTVKILETASADPGDGFLQQTVGSWAHLGATASSAGVMTLWRDGVTRDDGAWTKDDGVAANPSSIVYYYADLGSQLGSGYFFTGALRDVRLYARALPGAELAAIAGTTDRRDTNDVYKEATRAASCQYSIQGSQCTAPELAAAVSRRHDDGECELKV